VSTRTCALIALVGSFVAGFSILGALGWGSDSNAPAWAVRLPEGVEYGAWSPDGEVFAIPAHDRIELIETEGSAERTIEVPGIDNSGLSCECRLGWSKDGSEIHIVTRPRPRARGGIATVEVDGGNLRSRYLDLHVSGATWAPQGWPLILEPQPTDAGRPGTERSQLLRLGGLEAELEVLLRWRGHISEPVFSPDGRRIAFTIIPESPNGSLWIVSRDGGKPRRLLTHLLNPYLAWSPNGHELALSASFPRQDRHGLFLVSATSGKAKLLTSESLAERRPPAWTPDGRWITYASADSSVSKIRRDGTEEQRLFQLPGEEIFGLSWSPDGRHLAYGARPITPSG
jgi:WD40 repeat protein